MNSSRIAWVAVAMVLTLVSPAVAMFIDVQFIGGVDIAVYSSWSWGEGTPMPNQEVERATREAIEKVLSSKGYTRVDGEADFQMTVHVKKDAWFDGGLFKIELLDGKTGKVAWRAKAEGQVNVQGTPKRQKLAQRTVKKMFKKFPDKRTE